MEEFLAKLLTAYEDAENQLLAIVARYTLDGDELDQDTWTHIKLADIKRLKTDTVNTLQKLKGLDEQAQRAIVEAYLNGARTHSAAFIATNTDALSKFTASYLQQLQTSRYQILRATVDSYRRIIAEASTQAVVGLDTRLEAAKRALAKFAGEGITGFIDSAGRQWEIRAYTEMSTRTALNHAFREGRLAGLADTDQDLIIISSVPNPSDICAPWERQILSISGKSDKYPSLAEAQGDGLFHPNCRHSFTAYTPGLTKVEAPQELDNYEAVQAQRYMERKIREWKRRDAVGDDKAPAKIKEWRGRLKEHIAENNLTRKSNRESNVQAR